MNKLENIFNGAKNEIEKLWNENSALWDFVEFPKDLQLKNFNANKIFLTSKWAVNIAKKKYQNNTNKFRLMN